MTKLHKQTYYQVIKTNLLHEKNMLFTGFYMDGPYIEKSAQCQDLNRSFSKSYKPPRWQTTYNYIFTVCKEGDLWIQTK